MARPDAKFFPYPACGVLVGFGLGLCANISTFPGPESSLGFKAAYCIIGLILIVLPATFCGYAGVIIQNMKKNSWLFRERLDQMASGDKQKPSLTDAETHFAREYGVTYVSTRCTVCGTITNKTQVANAFAHIGWRIDCNRTCGNGTVEITSLLK